MRETSVKKSLVKSAIGVIGGIGIGLFIAPKKGSDLRKDLKNLARRAVERMKLSDLDDAKKDLTKRIRSLEREMKELRNEKVISKAHRRACSIKEKTADIVDIAANSKDKEIKKLANEVKKKTYEAVDEVLKELEED